MCVNQRPWSNQHIRPISHRSARAANMGPVTSTSGTVPPGAATTNGASEQTSSHSFPQTSSLVSSTQDGTVNDAAKVVSRARNKLSFEERFFRLFGF